MPAIPGNFAMWEIPCFLPNLTSSETFSHRDPLRKLRYLKMPTTNKQVFLTIKKTPKPVMCRSAGTSGAPARRRRRPGPATGRGAAPGCATGPRPAPATPSPGGRRRWATADRARPEWPRVRDHICPSNISDSNSDEIGLVSSLQAPSSKESC